MKSEVCGERGALQEWRAALERSASDIMAIEQFTKQDLSRAKVFKCVVLKMWFVDVSHMIKKCCGNYVKFVCDTYYAFMKCMIW